MTWYKHWVAHTILVGVLLGIGFVIPALWPLGLLGVGGVWILYQQHQLTYVRLWCMWFVKSLLVISWGWALYPMTWIGFDLGWIELPLIGMYWITVAAALGLGGVALFGLLSLMRRFVPSVLWLVIFPALWLVAELLAALAFSLFLYGPGGTIGFSFSMGQLGYLLAEHGVLVQLAQVAGVYGLTVVAVGVSVLGIELWRLGHKAVVTCGLVLLVVTSGVDIVSEPSTESTYQIAIIDTVLPVEAGEIESGSTSQVHLDALAAAKTLDPDYIIFPEDSRVFDQTLTSNELRALLAFWQADTDAVIIDSGRVTADEQTYLQAAVYDAGNQQLYQSHKRYLVPQGEYMPYLYGAAFNLFSGADTVQSLTERLAYRIGPETSQANFVDPIPGILFCFEAVDPGAVRQLVHERPGGVPFVAHLVSHAWIHPSDIIRQQLATMLRVQAIWNDIYIVSAGNHIPGYVVTPDGVIKYPEVLATGEYWTLGVVEVPVR